MLKIAAGVLGLLAVAGVLASGSSATGATANLWVVSSSPGSCTRAATPAVFNPATSCGSFNAAYQAAAAGDTILVTAGSYGDQTILHRSSGEVSPAITLSPDPGASVTVGGLGMGQNANDGNHQGPGYLTVNGPMTMTGLGINWSSHITVSGVTINGGYAENGTVIYLNAGSDHVTIQNTDACCTTDGKVVFTDGYGGPNFCGTNACHDSVSDIVLNNDYLHGVNWSNAQAHSECIYANGVARLTITNSRIDQCGTTGAMDVTTSGAVDAPVGPYLIQSNVWGDQLNASYNIQGVFPTGTTVSYNTFVRAVSATVGDTVMVGNIDPQAGNCAYNTSASGHNVFADHTCSPSDTVASAVFNSANWVGFPGLGSFPAPPADWSAIPDLNMHLTAANPAIGKGDPGNFPATDKDGTPRSTPPDAGAYTATGAPPPPPPPIPAPVVTACTGATYTLTWNAATGATSYNLYRDGNKVSSAGSGARSAKFLALCGTKSLGVSTVTAAGESTVTTQAVP